MSATKYLAALCVLFTMVTSASAQEQPGGDRRRGQGGPGGGGGGEDRMAEFRQRMNERMKEVMAATDAEWQVLQPRIEKVQQLQQAASSRGGMGMMFGGGRGGRDGGRDGGIREAGGRDGGSENASPVQQKTRDLQASIDNKDAKPEELKVKLAALREARQKAKADLTKAQEELREVLSVRQEAVLVMMGTLE